MTVICWSCERAAGDGSTCASCGAIQPPPAAGGVVDFFAVLGLPKTYALDLAEAERRFRELSRQFHPDRFAKADPRARRASLQRTVQLNDAWKTLRDPVARAEYLLSLAGYDLGAEGGASRPSSPPQGTATATATSTPGAGERIPVPAALLGEILEMREELSEARTRKDDGRIQEMAAEVRGRLDTALERVGEALARAEGQEGHRTAAREAAARELMAIRYFRRFLDEVDVHDESVASGGDVAHHA